MLMRSIHSTLTPFLLGLVFLGAQLLLTTVQKAHAQNTGRKIYAAVLANKDYIAIGAKNPGAGLFIGDEDGKAWHKANPQNMRTFGIAVFPGYGTGLYYTASGNGVFVSKDRGKSWRVTTDWQITEVLEIAAVADKPEIVYIGSAYGVWKSEQFGEDWQRLTDRYVAGLLLDRANPSRVYIGEEDRLVISNDAGKTPKVVKGLSEAVRDIAQDPQNPQRLYLGTEDHGVFISNDRGESWQRCTGAIAEATIYAVTVDAKNPQRLFAASFANGVFRSQDGGKSWRAAMTGLEEQHVHDVAIHPDQPTVIYAATMGSGIYRSTDGGESWEYFALNGTHVWQLIVE